VNEAEREDLEELFGRFLGPEEARTAAEDIRRGEEIIGKNLAPQVPEELVAEIKSEVAAALAHKKASAFVKRVYAAVAGAAAVIIVAVISAVFFESADEAERVAATWVLPEAIWESDDLAQDDAELAVLTAEIEDIEGDLLAVELGENGGNGQIDSTELEMELTEINGSFWKG
jgi:hypothetical protein